MNEEIIKVLDNLGQKFGIAIDWTSQNVLPYLQELFSRFIAFQNAQAIIWILISALVIVIATVTGTKFTKWIKKNIDNTYDDATFCIGLTWVICGSIVLAFLIAIICNIFGIVQNIYVPELTLIEYIQNI